MEKLNRESFKEKIIDYDKKGFMSGFKSDKPVFIKFFADWCGPCKIYDPIVEKIEEKYKDKIYFYKVDIQEDQKLAADFDIRSIPSTMLMKDQEPKIFLGIVLENILEKLILTHLIL